MMEKRNIATERRVACDGADDDAVLAAAGLMSGTACRGKSEMAKAAEACDEASEAFEGSEGSEGSECSGEK